MELIILKNKDSEKNTMTLPVALYPNNFMQDKSEGAAYHAKTIILGVCDDELVADDLISAGLANGRSKEQILKDLENERNVKLTRLAQSFIVDDGINRYQLSVKGPFSSESEQFSNEKHSIEISSHAKPNAKKLFAKASVVIRQGNSRKPEITEVKDLKSMSENALTKGGFLEIKGTNIKVCGDNADVGLYFEGVDDSAKTVMLQAKDLGINTQGRIACVVPQELEAGTYRIKIVTQFMGGNTLFRKEPQTAVYGSFAVV